MHGRVISTLAVLLMSLTSLFATPRPDVEISHIDVVPGRDAKGKPVGRAVPAVLAITTGVIMK